ncbi:unnamed protein product, partial [Staurois parvus]
MSGQYRYPPKCQDSTDIPQMSGQYRYPPNVRTVQISPKCQDSTDIPPNVRTIQISPKCQDSTDIPQMSGHDPFLLSRQSDVFHKRHGEFLKLSFF